MSGRDRTHTFAASPNKPNRPVPPPPRGGTGWIHNGVRNARQPSRPQSYSVAPPTPSRRFLPGRRPPTPKTNDERSQISGRMKRTQSLIREAASEQDFDRVKDLSGNLAQMQKQLAATPKTRPTSYTIVSPSRKHRQFSQWQKPRQRAPPEVPKRKKLVPAPRGAPKPKKHISSPPGRPVSPPPSRRLVTPPPEPPSNKPALPDLSPKKSKISPKSVPPPPEPPTKKRQPPPPSVKKPTPPPPEHPTVKKPVPPPPEPPSVKKPIPPPPEPPEPPSGKKARRRFHSAGPVPKYPHHTPLTTSNSYNVSFGQSSGYGYQVHGPSAGYFSPQNNNGSASGYFEASNVGSSLKRRSYVTPSPGVHSVQSPSHGVNSPTNSRLAPLPEVSLRSYLREEETVDDAEYYEEDSEEDEDEEVELQEMKGKQFGVHLVDIVGSKYVKGHQCRIPAVLVNMWTYLRKYGGLETEGIFRVPSSASDAKDVQEMFENNTFESCEDIHAVAAALKTFFRELPTPVLSNLVRKDISNAATPRLVALAFGLLKEPARSVVTYLLDICCVIAEKAEVNKMNPKNLTIVLAPNLFKMNYLNPMEGLQEQSDFFEGSIKARMEWRQQGLDPENDPWNWQDSPIDVSSNHSGGAENEALKSIGVLHSSELLKIAGVSFKPRWFQLYEDRLLYFEDSSCTMLLGQIQLSYVESIEVNQRKKENSFTINTTERQYHLAAYSAVSLKKWLALLCKNVCTIVGRDTCLALHEYGKNGWLKIKGQRLKTWKQRYFAITQWSIFYFNSDIECHKFLNMHIFTYDAYDKAFEKYVIGEIPTHGCRVNEVNNYEGRLWCFQIKSKERHNILEAMTDDDRDQWIDGVVRSEKSIPDEEVHRASLIEPWEAQESPNNNKTPKHKKQRSWFVPSENADDDDPWTVHASMEFNKENTVIHCGELLKIAGMTFKPRWFQICKGSLGYFEDATCSNILGALKLSDVTAVEADVKNKENSFTISTVDRQYHLAAYSYPDRMQWTKLLCEQILRVKEKDTVCLAHHHVYKKGWLTKQGQIRKTWKRRFFICTTKSVLYFASDTDGHRFISSHFYTQEAYDNAIKQLCLGEISTKGITIHEPNLCEGRRNVFQVATRNRQTFVEAMSHFDRESWVKNIRNSREGIMPEQEDAAGRNSDSPPPSSKIKRSELQAQQVDEIKVDENKATEWTPVEVCAWLKQFPPKIAEFAPVFESHGVDGDFLLHCMTQEELSEIVDKKLLAGLIWRKILLLRERFEIK